jgi:hypothetical protein
MSNRLLEEKLELLEEIDEFTGLMEAGRFSLIKKGAEAAGRFANKQAGRAKRGVSKAGERIAKKGESMNFGTADKPRGVKRMAGEGLQKIGGFMRDKPGEVMAGAYAAGGTGAATEAIRRKRKHSAREKELANEPFAKTRLKIGNRLSKDLPRARKNLNKRLKKVVG